MTNDELIVQPHRPSFSVIIPTHADNDALRATLDSLVVQSRPAISYDLEVIIVGDGLDVQTKAIVSRFAAETRRNNLRILPWYYALTEHSGTGNLPRKHGLLRARNDWVIFLDTGAAATYRMFENLCNALDQHPDVWIMTWDMLQLVQPVPIMTSVYAVLNSPRDNGLPYILPGCATAVRRDWAQQTEWPNVRASDWAYFSTVWDNMFIKDGVENVDDVAERVALIPVTLTVAYAFTKTRKVRWPLTMEEYKERGYESGFTQAGSPEHPVELYDGIVVPSGETRVKTLERSEPKSTSHGLPSEANPSS